MISQYFHSHFIVFFTTIIVDVDECLSLSSGCEQRCVNTQGSFYCECNDGFILSNDGRTCTINCGGRFTETNGTFQTPGWPDSYPQLDFRCTWIVENIPPGQSVAFIINSTAYGINSNPPSCSSEYIEFFDTADLSGRSVGKYCGLQAPMEPVVIDSIGARAVFQGRIKRNRGTQYVGVSITYTVLGKIHYKDYIACTYDLQCYIYNKQSRFLCIMLCMEPKLLLVLHACSMCLFQYLAVNECDSGNGGCEYICTDTIFSYECSCRQGYQLTSDQHTCTGKIYTHVMSHTHIQLRSTSMSMCTSLLFPYYTCVLSNCLSCTHHCLHTYNII